MCPCNSKANGLQQLTRMGIETNREIAGIEAGLSVPSRVGEDQHSGDNAKIGRHESNTVELGIRKTETPWKDKA